MQITTNNQKRALISFKSLPTSQWEKFSYVQRMGEDLNLPRFFKYKGEYYDAVQFSPNNLDWAPGFGYPACWNAFDYTSTNFGLVIRYCDITSVIVGEFCTF